MFKWAMFCVYLVGRRRRGGGGGGGGRVETGCELTRDNFVIFNCVAGDTNLVSQLSPRAL